MFDTFLAKRDFEEKLRSAGYTEERIVQEWQKLEKLFSRLCLVNALNALTEKEREQAMGGSSDDLLTPEQFFSRIKEYVALHADTLNLNRIFEQSAVQAYDKYTELLTITGESNG